MCKKKNSTHGQRNAHVALTQNPTAVKKPEARHGEKAKREPARKDDRKARDYRDKGKQQDKDRKDHHYNNHRHHYDHLDHRRRVADALSPRHRHAIPTPNIFVMGRGDRELRPVVQTYEWHRVDTRAIRGADEGRDRQGRHRRH